MRATNGEKTTVTDKVLKVALRVCDKRLRELDELIDDPNAFTSLVTEDEWAVLGADELNLESLAKQKHENWMAKNEVMQIEKKKKEKEAADKEKKKKKKKKVKKVVEKTNVENEEEAEENTLGDGVEGWESEKRPGEEDEDEDIIDDEDDEKEKVDQELDNVLAGKHPEYKRAVKTLEELKKKYP
jgi:hypothetical protein